MPGGNFPSNLIIYGGFPTLAKILIVLYSSDELLAIYYRVVQKKSPTHVNTYKISKNCPNEIKTGQRLNEVFLFH